MEEKTSILKRKSLNPTIANESVIEEVVIKDKGRRVSFSSNNYVKLFAVDDEKNTIWDSTFEEKAHELDEANKLEAAALSPDMELTCMSTTIQQEEELFSNSSITDHENNLTNDASVDMELTRMSLVRHTISYSKEINQAQLNDPLAVENSECFNSKYNLRKNSRSICKIVGKDEPKNGRMSVDMELTRNLQVNIAKMETKDLKNATNLDDMEFTSVLNTDIQEYPINQNSVLTTSEDMEFTGVLNVEIQENLARGNVAEAVDSKQTTSEDMEISDILQTDCALQKENVDISRTGGFFTVPQISTNSIGAFTEGLQSKCVLQGPRDFLDKENIPVTRKRDVVDKENVPISRPIFNVDKENIPVARQGDIVDKENIPVPKINIIRVDVLQNNMDFTNENPTFVVPSGGKFSILNDVESKESFTERECIQFPSVDDVSNLLETSDPCVSMSYIENDEVNSSILDSSYVEDPQCFNELQYMEQINLLVSQVQNRRSLDDSVFGKSVDGPLQKSIQEVVSCISAADDTIWKLKQAMVSDVTEPNREHEELLNKFKQAESFFNEFQWPKLPLVPFRELEKAEWESKSLEEKIEDYSRSSSQFWEYKKQESTDCFCFCTFHRLVCFKVYAHPITGVVREIEAFDNITNDAPAILFYLAMCVREKMKRKKLIQVLNNTYTIFSLLDYVDLFMGDLKKFEREYERLENSNFKMIRGETEQTFIFRCVFIAPEFLIGWKVMLEMSGKNIGSFSSLEVEIDEVMSEIVNKNTIWNLAKDLKGCNSLRTFTDRVHNLIKEVGPKRKSISCKRIRKNLKTCFNKIQNHSEMTVLVQNNSSVDSSKIQELTAPELLLEQTTYH